MSFTATILTVCCLVVACGAEPTELDDIESRFLFGNTSGLSVSVNPASVLVAVAAGTVCLLTALLLWYLLSQGGEESYTGYGTGSSYSSQSGGDQTGYGHSRGAADTWSTLSAVDWIALAQELYESADQLSSRPCQQRLVCQLAASASTSGSGTARAAVSAIDYLSYLEVMKLPADVKQVLQAYGDAAHSGRSAPADCELRYSTCSLSVSKLMDKYAPAATS